MNMKRPITLLLALSLVLSCTGQWIVHAEEAEDPALDPTLTESAATATVVPADSQTLLAEDMPFLHFIDDDQFSNANHVARLPEEERLDTYVFLNQDGTKSVYHMGRNVKFVDADGIIKEKDTTLVAAKGGYTMRSNDVHLLLPQNASDGVFLSHSDHNVRLIPTGGNGKTVMSEDAILYADYYGDGIHLKYTPTLSGVKEDIILESYTGMSSFTFRLESGDLELYQRAGVWCLAPGEDAETVFTLGQIIVYDAIGKPVAGAMTVEPAENGAYVLTVSAPVEFLTDPTTVYPVTIDPTLQIKDSAGQLNIEDATIFSGYPYSNSGSFVYNTIGYTDANYQIGRLAVRLTGLLSDSTYQGLTVDEIVKVTFNIKDGGSYYSGVNIHAIVGNSTWTESSVRWIDIPSYSSEVYATATMGGSYWASFDITNLVKDWKTGAQNGQCGFLMVGVNEDTKKIGTISCEYGTGTHWPYAIVTYENNSVLSKTVLKLNEGTSGGLTVQNPDNLALTWTSDNTNIATVSSTGTVTGVNAGTTTVRVSSADNSITASCTVHVVIEDGVYYIKNASSGKYLENTGGNVIVFAQDTGANTKFNQLWKITYVGNGRYAIRPMNDTSTALGIDSANDVVANETTTSNSMLSDTYLWSIGHDSTGYFFQRNGNPAKTLTLQNIDNTTGLIVCGTWTGSANCHWTLEDVKGIFLRDTETNEIITPDTVKYIELGDTLTPNQLGIGYEYYGSLIGGVTWLSGDPSVANIDNAYMFTGNKRGETVVTVSATLNGNGYSTQFTVIVKETISVINLYDSSLTNVEVAYIDNAVDFLNVVFSEQYHLYFEMDGNPLAYNLSEEISAHPASGACTDECGSACPTHHNNVNRIANELYDEYWERNHVVVMWSDYPNDTFCYLDYYGLHHTTQALGLVTKVSVDGVAVSQPIIQVINLNHTDGSNSCSIYNLMSLVLAHEIAHTLGMREVYEGYYGDATSHRDKSERCIMSSLHYENIDQIVANGLNALCPSCRSHLASELDGKDVYEYQ